MGTARKSSAMGFTSNAVNKTTSKLEVPERIVRPRMSTRFSITGGAALQGLKLEKDTAISGRLSTSSR